MTTTGETARGSTTRQQHSWRALVMGTTLLFDRLDDDLRREPTTSRCRVRDPGPALRAPAGRCGWPQLADALAHSRSRVTHTVARMEEGGLVRAASSPEDGRGVVATLTDKGYELLERAAPTHVDGVRAHLVDLAARRRLRRRRPGHGRGRRPAWSPAHPEMEIRDASSRVSRG